MKPLSMRYSFNNILLMKKMYIIRCKQLLKMLVSLAVFWFMAFSTTAGAQITDPDTDVLNNLEYIASYPDLMNTFGTNWQAGSDHYLIYGIDEGRSVSFDTCNYLASYPDLMATFGTDYTAAASQYITQGRFEGRQVLFSGLQYMLANQDVLQAVEADPHAACEHYMAHGRIDGHLVKPGHLLVGLGNKCLDAGGGNLPVMGSKLLMWDCVANVPQQQWTLKDDGRIVGIGGNCVTRNNGQLNNGTALIMWPCQADAAIQTWNLTKYGNLVSQADSSKCIDIAGLYTANGTAAWVWDCWGGSSQKWSVSAGVKLVGLAGKCLDAGAWDSNGPATLYSCVDVPQQQWTFDQGKLKGINGLCLSMQNSQLYSGAPLVMTPCSDDPGPTGQHWYMTTDKFIRSIDNTNLCINVWGANTADRSPVAAYTCTPSAPNDKWTQS